MPEIRTGSSKEKYWAKLTKRYKTSYPIAFKLFKKYGLLPESEGWANIVRHCLLEAAAMEVVARGLRLPSKAKDRLVLAGLIHDFYKRRELELIKKEGDSTATLEKAEKQSFKILSDNNIDQEIVQITDAIGITKLDRIKDPSCTLPEKAMFYIDSITKHDQLVTLEEKVAELPSHYPEIAKTGIYPIYLKVSQGVEVELAAKIGLKQPKNLPAYIKRKVFQTIIR